MDARHPLLVFACSAIAVSAQAPADIGLRLEAPHLTRTGTAIVRVAVTIPPGYFIPAETSGSVRGAWLQPARPGLDTPQMPTYPRAEPVVLGGANVLAYSGDIVIRVPVMVPPGMRERAPLALRLGYQLCDRQTCRPFQTKDVAGDIVIDEPQDADRYLAFRIDDTHVAIVLDEHIALDDRSSELPRPAAGFAIQLLTIPDASPVADDSKREFPDRTRWTLASASRTYDALVAQRTGFPGQCGHPEASQLTLVTNVGDPAFRSERAKYFLASPQLPAAGRTVTTTLDLIPEQRAALEDTLNRQMRITMPTLFAPPLVGRQTPDSDYHQRIRRGQGRLVYHIEPYRLAPDDDVRLYVRAHWALDKRALFGMTFWIRYDGHAFIIEQTDAGVARFALYAEAKDMGPAIAADPDSAGTLLNVAPSPDGWASIIVGRRYYEGFAVSVLKYSPDGPLPAGIRYAAGC